MRLSFSLLAIGLVLIGVPGCKKEAEILSSQQAQQEQRWLRIYHKGRFIKEINVAGWEEGEDVVELCAFYYPWQGEDSIDFNGHGYDVNSGTEYPWIFLNVNGKVVGVNTGIINPSTVPNKEDIITITYERELNVDALDFFPNLIGLDIPDDSLETVASRYPDLRLYVHCGEVTRRDLRRLRKYEHIRVIVIAFSKRIKAWDLMLLAKLKDLRILVLDRGEEDHITEQNVKYLYRLLPKLRLIELTPVTITI